MADIKRPNRHSNPSSQSKKINDKMVDRRASYTAADALPLKVILDETIRYATQSGTIPPIHVQFIPTNRCNQNCEFCSCGDRDKSLEMPIKDAKVIIDLCASLGTKAVTITGGGEPLMYLRINELISHFRERNIKVGLVSNGLMLYLLRPETLNKITWCRISSGDDRDFTANYANMLSSVVEKGNKVDWAFSHVVGNKPNMETIRKVVEFANEYKFTHVRLVADLMNPEDTDMEPIQKELAGIDNLVIYQGRKNYVQGGACYICYLKPVIAPDMKVYTCCGSQYALKDSNRDMPEELCLGSAYDLPKLVSKSQFAFNGSICEKCYYMDYNRVLGAMLKKIEHREFV